MHLLTEAILKFGEAFAFVFSNSVPFAVVFMVLGISCIVNKSKPQGVFLIFIALLVLGNVIKGWF